LLRKHYFFALKLDGLKQHMAYKELVGIIPGDSSDERRTTSDELLDPQKVHRKIMKLTSEKAAFIESEIRRFLKGYANRRYSPPSLERTTFVLSRLTDHPIYYIWFNPKLGYRI